MMKLDRLFPLALLVLIFGSFFLTFPDVNHQEFLTDEDGPLETIGALAFLVASILFGYCWFKSKGNGNNFRIIKTNRNLVFLVCSLLFFVAFGEEISWGQRIFNWETPESIEKINFQQETNLHNLNNFNIDLGENQSGIIGWLLVFNAGRLFFYFWFTLMIMIPVLNRFSMFFRNLFSYINIPIPPLIPGLLMIATTIIAKVFIKVTASYPIDTFSSIDEIMETNYALIIAMLAFHWARSQSFVPKNVFPSPIRNQKTIPLS